MNRRVIASLFTLVALCALAAAAPASAKKWEIAIGGGSETHVLRTDTDGFCSEYQSRKEDQEVDFGTPRKQPIVATGKDPSAISGFGGLEGNVKRSVSEDPCGPPEAEFAPPPQSDCGRRSANGNMSLAFAEKGTTIVVGGGVTTAKRDGLVMQGGVDATQPFRACSVSPQHAIGNYFLVTPGLNKLGKHERKRFEGDIRGKSCKEDAADSSVTSCTYSHDIVVEVTRVK